MIASGKPVHVPQSSTREAVLTQKHAILGAAVLVFFLVGALSFGQESLDRPQVLIFRASEPGMSVPDAALQSIESGIRQPFDALRSFSVETYDHSVSPGAISTLLEAIRSFRRDPASVPDPVAVGTDDYSHTDLKRIAGAGALVFPELVQYASTVSKARVHEISITMSVYVVDPAAGSEPRPFSVEAKGSASDEAAAGERATHDLSARLAAKIRQMPLLEPHARVIDLSGADAVVNIGSTSDIRPGDQAEVIADDSGGVVRTDGLLIIKIVRDHYAFAHPVYLDRPLKVGDRVRVIRRAGVEITTYADLMLGYVGSSSSLSVLPFAGVRVTITRGNYRVRPVAEMEVPIQEAIAGSVPVDLFVGLEMFNIYAGRFQFAPALLLGTGINGVGGSVYFGHFGTRARLTTSLLLSRSVKLVVEVGFDAMVGLQESPHAWSDSYSGGFLGVGGSLAF